MLSTQPRLLIVDGDKEFARTLAGQLHAKGFMVGAVPEVAQAPAATARFAANLILLAAEPAGEAAPSLKALRIDPRTAHLPMVVMAREFPHEAVLELLRAGAAAVLQKPFEPDRDVDLLRRLLGAPRPPGTPYDLPLGERLGEAVSRLGLDAELRTPTDPSALARYGAGMLVEARFGAKRDHDAEEALLADPAAVLRLAGTPRGATVAPPSAPRSAPPPAAEPAHEEIVQGEPADLAAPVQLNTAPGAGGRCLLVDDEPHLLKLFTAFLTRVGFEVSTAADGAQGFDACLVLRPAIVVADLNMPRLDGWGLLRKIRSDHRVAETPVVFLSAQDDYRESLRAVSAGAQDYLAKVTKMDSLARRIREVLLPRERVVETLGSGGGAHGRVEQLGVRWLLAQVASHKRTGVVACADGLGVYNVAFKDGAATFVGAQVGSKRFAGEEALALMVQVRTGDLQFLPNPPPSAVNVQGALPILLERVATKANEEEHKAIEGLMIRAAKVEVDGQMFSLYERFSGPQARQVAALIKQGKTPKQIIVESQISPLEVEDTIRDMIRRRVITLRG